MFERRVPLGALRVIAAAMVLASVAPRRAGAQEIEQNGIGCGYMIMVTFQGVAEACFPEEDRQMLQALNRTVETYDAFMLRNDPDATLETLDAFKDHHRNVWRSGATGSARSICDSDPNGVVELYRDFAATTDPQEVVDSTVKHLAVDRRPTMNPCL